MDLRKPRLRSLSRMGPTSRNTSARHRIRISKPCATTTSRMNGKAARSTKKQLVRAKNASPRIHSSFPAGTTGSTPTRSNPPWSMDFLYVDLTARVLGTMGRGRPPTGTKDSAKHVRRGEDQWEQDGALSGRWFSWRVASTRRRSAIRFAAHLHADMMYLSDASSARASSWDRSGGKHRSADRSLRVTCSNSPTYPAPRGHPAPLLHHHRTRRHSGATIWQDLVLRMYWDGETDPSVEVPFGDFLRTGTRAHQFLSLTDVHGERGRRPG